VRPLQYEWSATVDDTERHAHGAFGVRLCRPSLQVADPSYWRQIVEQPKKKCAACVKAARATSRQAAFEALRSDVEAKRARREARRL
jgi:hypothetical protein